MPVPKKKTSRSRRDSRRAHHDKTNAPTVVDCPKCHEPMLAHRVCPTCGQYAGREIISHEEAES
jgi:large subunit ribosomal protein L32